MPDTPTLQCKVCGVRKSPSYFEDQNVGMSWAYFLATGICDECDAPTREELLDLVTNHGRVVIDCERSITGADYWSISTSSPSMRAAGPETFAQCFSLWKKATNHG
jgi:hypothetical protein